MTAKEIDNLGEFEACAAVYRVLGYVPSDDIVYATLYHAKIMGLAWSWPATGETLAAAVRRAFLTHHYREKPDAVPAPE